MDVPGRHFEVLADVLEVDEVCEDLLDYILGDGLAGFAGRGELGVVEGDSGAGLVENWELAGGGVGNGEADAVAAFW